MVTEEKSAGVDRLLGNPPQVNAPEEVHIEWTKAMDDQLVIYFRDASSTFESIGEKMKLHPEAIRRRLHYLAHRREEMKTLRNILR